MNTFELLLQENLRSYPLDCKVKEQDQYTHNFLKSPEEQQEQATTLIKGFYCPIRNMFLILDQTSQNPTQTLKQSYQSDAKIQDMFSDMNFSDQYEAQFDNSMKEFFNGYDLSCSYV